MFWLNGYKQCGGSRSASFCRIRIKIHNIFHGSGSGFKSKSEPSSLPPPLPSSFTLNLSPLLPHPILIRIRSWNRIRISLKSGIRICIKMFWICDTGYTRKAYPKLYPGFAFNMTWIHVWAQGMGVRWSPRVRTIICTPEISSLWGLNSWPTSEALAKRHCTLC